MVGATARESKTRTRLFLTKEVLHYDVSAARCLLIGVRCSAIILASPDQIHVCTDHVHYFCLIPQYSNAS
jgi:hypothetical protein